MNRMPWITLAAFLSAGTMVYALASPHGARNGALDVYAVPATMRVPRSEDVRWDSDWAGPCPWPEEKLRVAPDVRMDRIELQAARREWESFQLVLRAEGAPVSNINVTISDLTGPEGARIAAEDIALFREYYVYVLQPDAGHWFPRIEYPDPLLPFTDPASPDAEPYGAPFDNTRIGTAGKPYRKQTAAGPAGLLSDGAYTGHGNRRYVIQIDTGGNAGEGATFRWSDSWLYGLDADASTVVPEGERRRGVRRWNAETVPIPAFGADGKTDGIPLNDGVAVRFTSGQKKGNALDFVKDHTFHFNTYEAMNEVVWGDIFVPADATPGRYSGTVTVTADSKPAGSLPITLTVWPFELPLTNSMVTAFHSGGGWPAELMLHNHKIDMQNIGRPGITIDKFLAGDDSAVDWTRFDQEVGRRLSGAAYPDGRPANKFNLGYPVGAEGWNWSHWVKGDTNHVARYARTEAQHMKEKGWFDRVYKYCHDEPYPEDMVRIARDIRIYQKTDPDWDGKFMAVSSPNNYTSEMGPLIDIWCFKFHWNIKPEAWDFMREHGQKVWSYVCNSPRSPIPSYSIDSLRGYEPRVIKWASWKLGAEGFLHWMMYMGTKYPNPWMTPMTDYASNGDGSFIYTGNRADGSLPLRNIKGPLPGFRLKQIREGLEDWEYLVLHEKAHGREATMALADEIYRAPGGAYGQPVPPADLDKAWTQDCRKLYEIRERLAEGIMRKTE